MNGLRSNVTPPPGQDPAGTDGAICLAFAVSFRQRRPEIRPCALVANPNDVNDPGNIYRFGVVHVRPARRARRSSKATAAQRIGTAIAAVLQNISMKIRKVMVLPAFAAVVYWRAMSLHAAGLLQAACGVTGDKSNAARRLLPQATGACRVSTK